MRSPFEQHFLALSDSEDATNSAQTTTTRSTRTTTQYQNSAKNIPYHARENSLPFSYGQIGKTSTPTLRKVNQNNNNNNNSSSYDFDTNTITTTTNYERTYGSGSNNGVGGYNTTINTNKINDNNSSKSASTSQYGLDASNSNSLNLSLNRNGYNYGTGTRNVLLKSTIPQKDATMIKAQPRLTSPLLVRKTLNPNNLLIDDDNDHSPTRNKSNTISNVYPYGGAGGGGGVNQNYSNYNGNHNSILRKTPVRDDFEELLRERREKVFNEFRSTSSLNDYQSLRPPTRSVNFVENGYNGPHTSTPKQKFQSNHNKFNYDFEFNLNLNDTNNVPPRPPIRSNTVERSSLKYQTRDIPIEQQQPVERNYRTLSTLLENSSKQQLQKQRLDYAAYGNGNGYTNDYGNRRGTTLSTANATPTSLSYASASTTTASTSPIYATTNKQLTNKINNNNNNINNYQNTTTNTYRNITTTTTATLNDRDRDVTDSSLSAIKANTLISPSVGTPLISRPETPAFPVTPRTPYGSQNGYNGSTLQLHSPQIKRYDSQNGQIPEIHNFAAETIYQTSRTISPNNNNNTLSVNYNRPQFNSNLSLSNSEPQEVAAHLVKFAKDSSKFWYKPNITREEAITLLLKQEPGTFIIRDSTTYKNAYGLVVRVAQPPPGSVSGKQDEFVRHFLIEPTTLGVRLKGCANEPVFTSLSALVYEHSINKLDLPCLLRIPEIDIKPSAHEPTPAQKQLLTQGAACNVLWLYSCNTESLTGEEAIRKAIRQMYGMKSLPIPTEVHFKVSQQGITLTDNTRKKFFRKHYTCDVISYCAIDPDHRLWTMQTDNEDAKNNGTQSTVVGALKKTIFAFVARRTPSSKDNQCHVFCDLAINQPASAIVSFANKTLPTEKQQNYVL